MGKFTPVKHIVRYSVILALVCYFGVIAVVNLPVVQQRLSAWVADELANLLHTEVTVGNISVGLLNRIIVQNVSVNDRSGKHLLSVSRLSAKYDPFELLFQKSIRISSVQLFGLNAQLARNDRNSPANFQFIVDALAPKDTVKKTSSLDLRINTILIRRGRIAYDILSEAETPKVFNPSHIDIQNLSATLSLKTLTPDSLNVQLRRMSFDEQSGFGLKKMTLQVEAGMYHTNVYGWEVQLPHSTFRMDTLAMAHARPALFAFDGETSYATRLQIDVTPSDFQAFVPRLAVFDIAELREVTSYDELELDTLGDRRTALFLIMSDTDDSFNFLISMCYTQLFNLLCEKADDVYGGRLPVHVRCLIDECANIGQIPKLEKLVATIRSREISACLVLQAQSQLKAIYKDNADTIIGNMDSSIFLGGKEPTTLKELEAVLGKETIDTYNTGESRGRETSHSLNYQKLGKALMSQDELAVMDGGKCILQLRGVRPFLSDKYDITQHPNYKYTADADPKNAFDIEGYLKARLKLKPNQVCDVYEIDAAAGE